MSKNEIASRGSTSPETATKVEQQVKVVLGEEKSLKVLTTKVPGKMAGKKTSKRKTPKLWPPRRSWKKEKTGEKKWESQEMEMEVEVCVITREEKEEEKK